jgi:sugar/nucleoside kinase (ribokinase family)
VSVDLVIATPSFLDLTVVGLEALPALGEERFAGDLLRSPGGGAITAVAATRLGLRTTLVATTWRASSYAASSRARE